jgi:hypothetical protein
MDYYWWVAQTVIEIGFAFFFQVVFVSNARSILSKLVNLNNWHFKKFNNL